MFGIRPFGAGKAATSHMTNIEKVNHDDIGQKFKF